VSDVPECARVKLAFLQTEFYNKVQNDPEICDWLTKKLDVYSFLEQNYAVDVLRWLRENYLEISDDDLVSTTIFLSQFSDKIDFANIPVILSDNRKMLLSQVKVLPGIQAVILLLAMYLMSSGPSLAFF